jgi:hypothetical protein
MLVGLGKKGLNLKKEIYIYDITFDSKNNVKSINNYITIKINLNTCRPTRPDITGENLATQSVDNSD